MSYPFLTPAYNWLESEEQMLVLPERAWLHLVAQVVLEVLPIDFQDLFSTVQISVGFFVRSRVPLRVPRCGPNDGNAWKHHDLCTK